MIVTDYVPQAGDFFLARSNGAKWWLYSLLQLVTGEPSLYTHAGLVLDDGTYLEARPGGAVIRPLETLWERKAVAFSQNDLSEDQRAALVASARALVGTQYTFTRFFYLAARTFGWSWAQGVLDARCRDAVICSELVARIYELAGLPLFPGRKPGDVSPGSFAHVGRVVHFRAEDSYAERSLSPTANRKARRKGGWRSIRQLSAQVEGVQPDENLVQ